VLDPSRTYVQKIAACGAAFPIADPMGGSFNYDSEKPYNDTNQDISIPFHCLGAIYQDPILLYTFNKTVQDFNHSMTDANRSKNNTKIPMAALQLFNNRGYPHINPDTWELEWWIDNATYNQLLPVTGAYLTEQTHLTNPLLPTGTQNPSGIANSPIYTGGYTAPSVNTTNVNTSIIQSSPISQNNS
jgi:hypothetical protein